MTFSSATDFINQFYSEYNRNSQGQRIGQFAVNYLRSNFILPFAIPQEVDCFYDDSILPVFLNWVAENWNID
jgi:hypothetical protein